MEEEKIKKHRGRPKRIIPEGVDPNSIESNVKNITDSAMEPYFISMDNYGFTVVEKITPNELYNPGAKGYTKPIGHYSKFIACLESIAKQKINNKSYTSIQGYISEFDKITQSLKNVTNI